MVWRFFQVCSSDLTPLADKASDILSALCLRVSSTIERPLPQVTPQDTPTWVLKANVTVFRHADRTPKVIWLLLLALTISNVIIV